MQRKLLLTCVLSFALASSGIAFLPATTVVQAASNEPSSTASSMSNVSVATLPGVVDADNSAWLSFSFNDPFGRVRAILQELRGMKLHSSRGSHYSRVIQKSHGSHLSQKTHITQSGNGTNVSQISQSVSGTNGANISQVSQSEQSSEGTDSEQAAQILQSAQATSF
jgi:hypothetical protein